MKATIQKRAFSLLLVLTLILGLLPVSALAAEGDPDTGTPVVCAGDDADETCAAASHVEGCPLYETPKEPAEEAEESIPADSAVSALQERIDALLDADTLEKMDEDGQAEVCKEVYAIYDAIDELTAEEAADLDTDKLEAAAAFFTRQTMTLTTTDDEDDEPLPDGTLSVANGSILITSTGYSQGTLTQDPKTKQWSVTDSQGAAVTETTWGTSDETHALTITGSADSSTEPYVFVQSGTVSITLQSVTASISAPSTNTNIPVIAIYQGAQAAITLDGESTLTPGTKAAGVQVAGNNGSLTISGDGTLNSTIGSAFANTYANSNNYHRGGGKLTVESGTINGNILDKNGGLEVEINGGTVNGSITNSKASTGKEGTETTFVTLNTKVTAGVVMGKITCNNGNVTISGGTVEGAITCSEGTVSITGGNINTGYTADISGRTLTQLYFADESGEALANKEVTVTEGETSWTAQTNSEGMITTYLASSTTSVTAKVGKAEEGSTVTIKDGKGLSGVSCACGGENPGALAMSTTSKGLTVTGDSAILKLEAAYTPSTDCKVPSGFHGDYETISYEIVSVTRNGQFVTADRYAAISGNTLTVYGDVDRDAYAVKVRAVCGPEDGKLSSDEIEISVSTYVSSVDEEENTLDIAFGSILITSTGYSQGTLTYANNTWSVTDSAGTAVTETTWGDTDETHALTITGSYEYSDTNASHNLIMVTGGNPTITLDNVTIVQDSSETGRQPGFVLVSGSEDSPNTATLVLSGTNTLSGTDQAPGVQINKNATLTIQGDGTLNATGYNHTAGIGAARHNTYAKGNTQSGGNLIIEGGTINATGSLAGASIGASHSQTFGDITIKGGEVNALRTSVGSGISTKTYNGTGGGSITIEGGVVNAASQSGSNQKYDAIHAESGFSMTGGTLNSLTLTGSTDGVNYISVGTGEGVGISITGGNVNGYYTGSEKDSRVLTKLYFVNEDGSPVANTEVSVTEGTGEDAKTWTALTNDKGVITTYFASGTSSISVSYGDYTNESVSLGESHQALIGGTCTCSNFTDITWVSGLPGSVTLFGESESTYSVADAALVVEGDCPMPIHPNLTAITYSLSVTANGSTVDESSTSTYAALENGTLTLKPASDPYTVTLTATAGEKTVTQTIQVLKGASEEGVTTIDLSNGDVTISYNSETSAYSYTQGSSEGSTTATGNILLTGDAASATVTVNGGSPTLTVNQNSPDNVWAIYTDASVTDLTLNAQTVNGKVRFGAADSKLAAMSYISAEKVKLNPETGAEISLTGSGVTQGIFTLSGISGKALSVYGANGNSATTLTNSTSEAATLTVNGASVELAAGGSYTIPKAVIIDPNSADNSSVYAYVIPNDRTLYCYNAFELGLSEDVNRNYAVEDIAEYVEMWRFEESASERLTQTTAQAYTILFIGEGATAASTYKDYPYKDVEGHDNAELYRGQITDVTFDPDIDTLAGNILRGMLGVVEIRVEDATTVSGAFYSCGVRKIYLGEQVTSYSSSNYMGVLKEIEVAEGNTALMSHDGVLYTADGKTLLQCPARKAGSYTLLDTCEAISNVAFYSSRLSALTLDANLKSIGTRAFESMWNLTAIHVKTGNASFKAVDGVLYSADGATLILYPLKKPDAEFEIPEGVTKLADMAFYQYRAIKKVTLPSTLASVDGYFMDGVPLEEMVINGPVYTNVSRFDTQVLRTVTVMDGYDFAQSKLFAATSMEWVGNAVTVSGVSSNENIPYDGAAHGITVTTTATDAKVEYSKDGVTYSKTAPTYTEPGTYTIYWRITKAADDDYEFARELYSSRTFTISALEASEDWFTLNTVGTSGTSPVALSQPAAAPSLENGYTVKYSKDGTGEATEAIPTEAGQYLVTVDITADGYAKETLTLGYYTILSTEQSNSVVLSFITYGGNAIEPLIWSKNETDTKTAPADPTRNGYTFAGWYSDASLHTKVEITDNSISKPDASATWYAQWTRDTYTITYNDLYGAKNDNPATYTVESPTFTLNAPVLAGYLFKGWKTSDQIVPSSSVTIEQGSYGDKTYTAVWELIQYTIEYANYTDGIEGNPTSYSVTDTTSKGLSLTAPAAREGYTFSGWQMTVNGMTYILPAEDAEIPQGTVGNIVLSGIWLVQGQTLTLNATGGAFADGKNTMTITADYASSITLTQPTRSGYAFAGWYADNSLETPFDASTMPLTMTIYAKWTSSLSINPSAASITGSDTVTLTVENAVGTVSVSCSDASISMSSSGNTWTATLPNKDATYTFTVSAENGAESCNVTVTYKSSGGSGGSSSGSSTYTVTVDSAKNGSVSVSPKNASKGTTVTITVKPDSGYELDDLTVTDKNGGTVKLTRKSDTQYTFTMPASKVTVEANFTKIEEQPAISFVDVSTSAYYYDAVEWAVENGVTSGTSATTFSPDAACTRAQAVTFLWRAAGSPTPKSSVNPFADVPTTAYYYDAVLWALEQGITVGTSATTFSPDATCTRGQIVTFLFRAIGTTTGGTNPFVDVADSAYYADAVKWAVAESVTVGTSASTFSPDASCTRAQIVTFLYRAYA